MAIGAFTGIDWLVLVVMLWSVVVAVRRGFLRELIFLISVLVGVVLSVWLYRPASTLFVDIARTDNLALLFGFAAVFIGTLAAGVLAGIIFQKVVAAVRLQWFDRLLGAAFGFIRGWVIGAMIFLGFSAFEIQVDAVKNAQLAPYFLPGSRALATLAPYDLRARFMVAHRNIRKWWAESTTP